MSDQPLKPGDRVTTTWGTAIPGTVRTVTETHVGVVWDRNRGTTVYYDNPRSLTRI